MIRLTKVELRRLFARRLTLIGLVAALLGSGLMLFATYQESKPLPADQVAASRIEFDRYSKSFPADLEQCKLQEAKQKETDPAAAMGCDQMVPPRWEDWIKPETVFSEAMPSYLLGGTYLLLFIAFLLGAGFIGAEYSSGALGSWLTFEPRRLRVYASKLSAAFAGLVPMAIGFVALLIAGGWIIIDRNGSTAGMTGERWGDFAEIGLRVTLLTAVAAMLGVVIGGLFRHTAAALGLAMAYLVIVEGMLMGLVGNQQPWLLRLNFDSWIKHGTTYYVENCRQVDGYFNCESLEKQLSFGHSAVYLAVLTVVVVVLGAVVFRRRDVT
ncbi:ABC transporter permease subunit [Kribbella sp. NBC_01245]|uniref:ABC transporter permease subunit n=1 Tax=Kribbella sp. NBC_01245 TaxID=2903578 RepID=UPI002E2D5F8B|nr:ABC transporter permease subunit [Kribbella sp. NBC_01245]